MFAQKSWSALRSTQIGRLPRHESLALKVVVHCIRLFDFHRCVWAECVVLWWLYVSSACVLYRRFWQLYALSIKRWTLSAWDEFFFKFSFIVDPMRKCCTKLSNVTICFDTCILVKFEIWVLILLPKYILSHLACSLWTLNRISLFSMRCGCI